MLDKIHKSEAVLPLYVVYEALDPDQREDWVEVLSPEQKYYLQRQLTERRCVTDEFADRPSGPFVTD
jgi:hypothetical protein